MPQPALQDPGDWITLGVSELCLQIRQLRLRPGPRCNSARVAAIGSRAIVSLRIAAGKYPAVNLLLFYSLMLEQQAALPALLD